MGKILERVFLLRSVLAVALVAGAVALAPGLALALEGDPVTLDTAGFNVTGHINAGVDYLVTILTACLGAWFTFRGIQYGLRWARTAFR